MKKKLMASVAAAVLTLSFSGSALADCAEEIAALKSQQYTGSIDTSEDSGAAPDELIDEGSAAAAATEDDAGTAPDELIDEGTASADAAVENKKPVAGQVPGTQATAAMNKAVGDRATSAEDVRAQDAGEPTAAQQADAAQEAPEVDMQIATAESGSEADQFTVLLQRAEEYQKLGNEEACMNVIEEADALVQ